MEEYIRFNNYVGTYRKNMDTKKLEEYIHYHSLLKLLLDLHKKREETILEAIKKCEDILMN